ncbi:GPP34 family phosphoprotein [Amycolatopsis benzoatilytica]|uniref:GPP34 family phosphoprotein n=1 Tax=Amycolatopsis benzoatilytica TaxID=346045 RepID=UPI00036E831B|nr:GPP34 family phosphoprotein [Amycolatopsis benzoatilytica]
MSNSLPAQAYFLACDPDGGPLARRGRAALLVRAAALADLLLRGNLRDQRGHAERTPAAATGDLVLDDLLSGLRPDTWRALLRHGRNDTLQALETQLSAAGMLVESSSAVLRRTILVPTRSLVREAHVRCEHALAAPLSEVDSSAAALAALAAAVGIVRPRHSSRLAELESVAGPVLPALRKAVSGRRAAFSS